MLLWADAAEIRDEKWKCNKLPGIHRPKPRDEIGGKEKAPALNWQMGSDRFYRLFKYNRQF